MWEEERMLERPREEKMKARGKGRQSKPPERTAVSHRLF